jgi:hypothetical protein
MTDTWQCDKCERNFVNTRERIDLARKIRNGPTYEYVSYQDLCTDCELYNKKSLVKRRRNNDTGNFPKS